MLTIDDVKGLSVAVAGIPRFSEGVATVAELLGYYIENRNHKEGRGEEIDATEKLIQATFKAFIGKGPDAFIRNTDEGRTVDWEAIRYRYQNILTDREIRANREAGGAQKSKSTETKKAKQQAAQIERAVSRVVVETIKKDVVEQVDPEKVLNGLKSRNMAFILAAEELARLDPGSEWVAFALGKLRDKYQSLMEYERDVRRDICASLMQNRAAKSFNAPLTTEDLPRPLPAPVDETPAEAIANHQLRSTGGVIRIESGAGR